MDAALKLYTAKRMLTGPGVTIPSQIRCGCLAQHTASRYRALSLSTTTKFAVHVCSSWHSLRL